MQKSKRTGRIALVAVIAAVVISLLYTLAAPTRSRVTVAKRGKTVIFIDKYIAPDRRADFIARYPDVLSVIYDTLSLPAAAVTERESAVFATKSDYGILTADDPLIRAELSGRPSGDFRMFSIIARGFFANELAADSCVSDDGYYLFLNADKSWEDSLVHAMAHSMANRALPAEISMRIRHVGGSYDPLIAQKWRFLDETAALFLSELRFAFNGPVNASTFNLSKFETKTAARYTPGGLIFSREEIQYAVSFDLPPKSADYYTACHEFAVSLIERSGFDSMKTFLIKMITGEWKSINDLTAPFGSTFDELAAPFAARTNLDKE